MSRVILEKKIYLEPKEIGPNIKENLKNHIDKLLGTCSLDFGYIVNIHKGIQIIGNSIPSSEPGSFFTVRFEAKTLKPEAGEVYEGVVCMIFPDGIFVEVAGKMKVLIPAPKLQTYVFQKVNNTFVSGSKIIKKDDVIKVKIDFVKYEKGKIGCIGSLPT